LIVWYSTRHRDTEIQRYRESKKERKRKGEREIKKQKERERERNRKRSRENNTNAMRQETHISLKILLGKKGTSPVSGVLTEYSPAIPNIM